MAIFIGILTFIEVLVCLLLILFVLMQRPRQEGLGASFGEGMMSQIAGAQTTNVLQKLTVYLAILLFILTLTLAVLTARQQTAKADVKVFDPPPPAAPATSEAPKPVAPEAAKKEEAPAAKKDEAPVAKKEVAPAAAPKAAVETSKPAAPAAAPAAAKEAAPKANP